MGSVRGWSCAVDGSHGKAYRGLAASHPDAVEIDGLARPSCRNRSGSLNTDNSCRCRRVLSSDTALNTKCRCN